MKYKVYANYQVKFFDDIDEAFKFAQQNIYISHKEKRELMHKLSLGQDITFSYGFNSGSIYVDSLK